MNDPKQVKDDTPLSLLFSDGSVVEMKGKLSDDGCTFEADIEHWSVSQSLLHLFLEYDKAVNGQVFNYADDISKEFEKLSPKVNFAQAEDALVIEDLQVYPTNGRASFRVLEVGLS